MLLISLIFQRHREDALKVMLSLTHLEDEVTEGALMNQFIVLKAEYKSIQVL